MLAAVVNRVAASIVSLAEERARSSRTRQGFARLAGLAGFTEDAPPPAEKLARLEHEGSLAELMAAGRTGSRVVPRGGAPGSLAQACRRRL